MKEEPIQTRWAASGRDLGTSPSKGLQLALFLICGLFCYAYSEHIVGDACGWLLITRDENMMVWSKSQRLFDTLDL